MSKLDTVHNYTYQLLLITMGSNFSTQSQPQTLEQAVVEGRRKAQIQEEKDRKKSAEQDAERLRKKEEQQRKQTEWLQSPQAQKLKAELLRMIANGEDEFSSLAYRLSNNIDDDTICQLMNTDTYTVNITNRRKHRGWHNWEQIFVDVRTITVVQRSQPQPQPHVNDFVRTGKIVY
jgi:ATP-dependent 26S proteasome regulatory subunit